MNKMNLFITKTLLYLQTSSEGMSYILDSNAKRSYELLAHAENILHNHSNKEYLTDCILNINKSIDIRLNMINRIYSFNNMPNFPKNDLWLKLESLNIIRKYLINEINRTRNILEHEDGIPPTKEKCQYYIEAVWFFLKATEFISNCKNENLLIDIAEHEWMIFTIDFSNNWMIHCYANLNKKYIKKNEGNGILSISINDDFIENKNDMYLINGEISVSQENALCIYTKYFSII